MSRERIPEDPDFAPDWKKTLVGLLVSAGLILIFVALVLLVTAALTEFTYQTMVVPSDVQALLNTTRQTSYVLLVLGSGLLVIGYIERR